MSEFQYPIKRTIELFSIEEWKDHEVSSPREITILVIFLEAESYKPNTLYLCGIDQISQHCRPTIHSSMASFSKLHSLASLPIFCRHAMNKHIKKLLTAQTFSSRTV